MPPRHRITAPPHHHVTVSVSHLPCPLPPNQSVICLAPCHQTSQSFALPPTTASLRHHITTSPHHRVTVLVSHLPCPLPPNQSVICLAPCHQTSQSFALPPTTVSPHHHATASLHHRVTASLHHRVTVLVSHLPCPLPINQSVICLAPCHQTSQSFALPLPPHHRITASPHHRTTASLHHHATASPHHRITVSPHHCVSQSFALPPATKPVSHLPCPLPSHHRITRVTASPHHCITTSPCHCVSQSFALPRATKPVSHLPCPLPPNQSVICLAPYHCVTTSLHHRITVPLRHCITASLCHCVTASDFSPPHGYESDWLMLTSTVVIG